jgi:hypothetical protein
MLAMFTPINNVCLDCNKPMMLDERQELAWDKDDNPRRRCGHCIQEREKQQ